MIIDLLSFSPSLVRRRREKGRGRREIYIYIYRFRALNINIYILKSPCREILDQIFQRDNRRGGRRRRGDRVKGVRRDMSRGENGCKN